MSNERIDDQGIALPERRRNRPVTLMHRVEWGAAALLITFFRLIGIDAASWVSGKFMRVVGPLLGPISRRAADNMRYVRPDWSHAEIQKTTRDVWENLGRTAAEFAHLENLKNSIGTDRLKVIGQQNLDRVITSGGPAIFVSGHFANWEVGAIILQNAGLNYGIIYRAANNPLIDGLIIKARGDVMTRRHIPKGKRSARGLIDTLQSGASLAMLVDQKLTDGISTPLLGKPAMTAPAPARLALKFKAPVIMVSTERRDGAHFTVTIHDPIDYQPTGEMTEDVAALTAKINDAISADIEARPGQWLWLHRRWGKQVHEMI